MADDLDRLIRSLPKAELHLHIEGTLEPELMFEMAARNGVELVHGDVDSLRAAYEFTNLQSFLDIYYQGAAVLRTEEDFADLMRSYLQRAIADGVKRTEIFFDPQTHTARGIRFETFMRGFETAQKDFSGQIESALILCFLRHLSEEEALETLRDAEPFLDQILAVGLDSSELGNPPEKFTRVFERAKAMELRAVAHAGEEGPPAFVWQALDVLGAERIDHGVRSMEDPGLVRRLAEEQIPLTICPLSNLKLQVVSSLADHPIRHMLEAGLNVSIHSDDPAYFGGYIGDTYLRTAQDIGLSESELAQIANNSMRSALR